MALSDYINDTQQLLNDTLGTFTSQTQLIRWINEARSQCAKRTGCIRRLVTGQSAFGASTQPGFFIPGAAQPGMMPNSFAQAGSASSGGSDFNPDFKADFGPRGSTSTGSIGAVQGILQVIPGVERYPYEGFFNPVLQSQHAGCDKVIDTIACSVNWGGTIRPSLDWLPWDDFQAYMRSYAVLNMSYPSVWSCDNDGPMGAIWLFPVPTQPGEIELDCYVTPKNLYANSDFDAIPEGFRESIKFGAAALVYMATKRYSDAQIMMQQFSEKIGVARVAVDRGKTPSYYWSVP